MPPSPAQGREKAWRFYRGLIGDLRVLRKVIAERHGPLEEEDVTPLEKRVEELHPLLKDHPDSLMPLFCRSTPEDYLIGKQANIGVLAGRISSQLGDDPNAVSANIMTGFLLHVGLFQTDRLDLRAGILDPIEVKTLLQQEARGTKLLLQNISNADTCLKLWSMRETQLAGDLSAARARARETLPSYARILEVVEVYEALSHVRPYRCRMPPHDALRFIIDAGTEEFHDGTVIKALIQVLSIYPLGSYVELNDGIVAMSIGTNAGMPTRPILIKKFDKEGARVPAEAHLNLGKNPLLRVQKAIEETDLNLPSAPLRLDLRAQLWWPAE